MIYLIRQGQTDWNLLKRFNGRTETVLNQKGISQAALHAEKLKEVSFHVCFCSPRKRAIQTCKIICKEKMILDERLAEIECGFFEGIEETAEALERFWQAVMKGERGTERFDAFLKRNCEFGEMIIKKYKGKDVLIVTHAANVRALHYYFSGCPKDFDFKKPVAQNGEILTFVNDQLEGQDR